VYWVLSGNKIANKDNLSEVIEVKDAMTVDGAEMSVAEYSGAPNQHWDFHYI